jgi:hypothetical protein
MLLVERKSGDGGHQSTLKQLRDFRVGLRVNDRLGIGYSGIVLRDWYKLVDLYSQRDLTYPSDVIPAIRGIARTIEDRFGHQFVAGLWMGDLKRGLLWKPEVYTGTRDCQQTTFGSEESPVLTVVEAYHGFPTPRGLEETNSAKRSTRTVACPSWSWISQFRAGRKMRIVYNPTASTIEPSYFDLEFGSVWFFQGTIGLTIYAFVWRATVQAKTDSKCTYSLSFVHDRLALFFGVLHPDVGFDVVRGQEVMCVLCSGWNGSDLKAIAVLVDWDLKANYCKRFGLVEVSSSFLRKTQDWHVQPKRECLNIL